MVRFVDIVVRANNPMLRPAWCIQRATGKRANRNNLALTVLHGGHGLSLHGSGFGVSLGGLGDHGLNLRDIVRVELVAQAA